ncbi:MAG: hypothetical protein IJW95_02535 [Clostridia bacterium]|nr:hypothetical protein [Clostridia bacterium]
MTTYHAADSRATTGNPLCDKLRRQYSQRCAAAARRSVPTSELMARVQQGLNPYENISSVAEQSARQTVSRPAPQQQVRAQKPVAQQQAARRNPTAKPGQENVKKSAPSRPSQAAPATRKNNTAVSRVRRAPAIKEVRMSSKPFPLATVSLLAIFTVMIMVIIVSFAQNYELSSDIAALEAQAQALAQSERELTLALEERDDIRVIEDIAINRIGMVRGNLVESRFVSVSGGDRIVLNYTEQDTATREGGYGLFSTMLSVIGENLDKLREYVD